MSRSTCEREDCMRARIVLTAAHVIRRMSQGQLPS